MLAGFRCTIAVLSISVVAQIATAQNPAPPSIRDSAGVRIVEHTTVRTSRLGPQIREQPTLTFGGLRADIREELSPTGGFISAHRLSDGRIVVNDMSALKFFDANGSLLRIAGRKGQGPGEFVQILKVCIAPGDTIIAFPGPGGGARFTVFNREGEYLRTSNTRVAGSATSDGCFSDGSTLVQSRATPNPATTLPPERAKREDLRSTLSRVRTDGSLVGGLGVFSGGTSFANGGRASHVVRADSIYVGDGQRAEFRVHDPNGRLVRIVRWRDAAIPIPAGTTLMSGGCARGSACNPNPNRSRLDIAYIPFYESLKVDDSGRVWIEDHRLAPEPRGWTVFTSDGGIAGRVTLPALSQHRVIGTAIAGFDGDRILLRWMDADGARRLSYHPMIPPGR